MSEATLRQTLDQRRAAYAWECVRSCSNPKDYTNLVKGAPALIMGSGLMQTLAYYQDKGKPQHRDLIRHLLGWLCGEGARLEKTRPEFADAMRALYESEAVAYRRTTEEALALLRWLRQLAAARGGGS